MLVLSREIGQRIRVRLGGETAWIEVVEIDRGRVRLGFTAALSVEVMREEVIAPETGEPATTGKET